MNEHDAKAIIDEIAAEQWAALSERGRSLIKFGMTPFELTEDKRLHELDITPMTRARLHAVALMTCAGDGMVV